MTKKATKQTQAHVCEFCHNTGVTLNELFLMHKRPFFCTCPEGVKAEREYYKLTRRQTAGAGR